MTDEGLLTMSTRDTPDWLRSMRWCAALVAPAVLAAGPARALVFTPGDLVVSVVGNVNGSGPYTDNQAAPILLQQLTPGGAQAGSLLLPQTAATVNGVVQSAISGEYGSSSEGLLQRSGDGQSLVIAGYGVNAATYNAGGAAVYGNAALAQSTSVPGGAVSAVPRVVANVTAAGAVDTSTALFNVFNTNNPRSVATVDGSTFYLAGQGVSGDTTQGVFVAKKGASSATAIDTSTDARSVQIANGQLYVSKDNKAAGTATIDTYGSLPTGATAPVALPGIGPTVTPSSAQQRNGVNTARTSGTGNQFVYLSPEQYFFANPSTLYIADAGKPKNGSANAAGVGAGGLQKWVLTGGNWVFEYDLSAGLSLVNNATAAGTTGLIGLAGVDNPDGSVSLYATNETVGDLDPTFVFAITDQLNATSPTANEAFSTIYTAAAGTNVRGIALAPQVATAVPEPASMALLGGVAGLAGLVRRRQQR